ncbi:MAG: hypothetical protein IJU13_01350 [Bacteroidales bacterium]|nr:hypothetical protein [Bacteroidales bacterium]
MKIPTLFITRCRHFCCVVGLTLLSCSRSAEFDPVENIIGEGQVFSYTVAFSDEDDSSASTGNNGEGGKSVLNNRHLTWEGKDRVGVFVRRGSSAVCANLPGDVYTDVSPRSFKFFSTAALAVDDNIYAYAPYSTSATTDPTAVSLTLPAEQYQVVEQVDPNNRQVTTEHFNGCSLPLVAIPTRVTEASSAKTNVNGTTRFCNLASLVCLKFYSDDGNGNHKYSGDMSRYFGQTWNIWNYVNSVTFSLTSGTGVSGTGTVDMTALDEDSEDDAFSLLGADGTSVTVHTGVRVTDSVEEAGCVYLALLPGTWSGTLTITTTIGDFHFTLSNVTFKRSKIKTINVNLDNDADAPQPPDSYSGYGTEASFSTIRSKLSSAGTKTLHDTDFHASNTGYRLFGVIIGDCDNPNMDQNLQYGTTVDGYDVTAVDVSDAGDAPDANHIYTTENDRTNYIQSSSGDYGFRLKFANPRQNIYKKGDKLYIFLDGVQLIRQDDPTRYTLAVDEDTRILLFDRWTVNSVNGSTHSPNYATPKALSELTDQMIYTNVRIKNVEFQVKRGAYANVREYDAIANPVNKGLGEGSKYGANPYPSKDGAANLLYDGDGQGIYMLMNMNCDWRYDSSSGTRKQVPQGKGSIAGILVHQEMERWGGDIGTYSLRPMQEEDIAFSSTLDSPWNDWVEWSFSRNDQSNALYSWNNNTGAGGFVTTPPDTDNMYQNKLNAYGTGMTNETGEKAQLYCENTKAYQSFSLSGTYYWVKPQYSTRGLNVQDYSYTMPAAQHGQTHTFGLEMSAIEYTVNPSGFYTWSDGTGTPSKGLVTEFSTSGASGTDAAIGFSVAGGAHDRTNSAVSWTFAASFPVNWKVQWATSDDSGSTWSAWQETGVANVATGDNLLKMRSVPFCAGSTSQLLHSLNDSAKGAGGDAITHADWGFGMVPYRFSLPSSVLGKSRVRVRLIPVDTVMAQWNGGSGNWMLGQEYRSTSGGEYMTETFIYSPYYTAISLEDVKFQYK